VDFREIYCKDGKYIALIYHHVRWWTLVLMLLNHHVLLL
jgi:hypothetical protein